MKQIPSITTEKPNMNHSTKLIQVSGTKRTVNGSEGGHKKPTEHVVGGSKGSSK